MAVQRAPGTHDYSLTVTSYVGSTPAAKTIYGRHALVNDITSPFGNRWWLDGLDRLYAGTGRVMLRSERGVTTYLDSGAGGYVTPAGYTATLVRNGDLTYRLSEVDGSRREFDSGGLLTQRVDAAGNSQTYAYTAGLLTSITDELGGVTTLAYTSGRLSTMTDFDGKVTSYQYDAGGRLTSITRPDPDGAGPLAAPVMGFGYDATTNLLTSSTDSAGKVTKYQYNFAQRIAKITHPTGAIEEFDAARGSMSGTLSGPSPPGARREEPPGSCWRRAKPAGGHIQVPATELAGGDWAR